MSVDEAAAGVPVRETAGDWDVGRSTGCLVVAWQHPETRLIAPVGLLEHGAEDEYRFRYLRRAREVVDFAPFISFPEWERSYLSTSLFPLFAQRIMSPRRPDFSSFLQQLDLREDASPWEQLARSEGRSSGDTVQVFPIPAVCEDGRTRCRFLVHGVRHVNGGLLPALVRGQPLALRAEPSNPQNSAALLVCTTDAVRLGYVPDLLLDHVEVVRADPPSLELAVEHVNPGVNVPPHFRLLVRLDGRVPPGYRPMTGPAWETFS